MVAAVASRAPDDARSERSGYAAGAGAGAGASSPKAPKTPKTPARMRRFTVAAAPEVSGLLGPAWWVHAQMVGLVAHARAAVLAIVWDTVVDACTGSGGGDTDA